MAVADAGGVNPLIPDVKAMTNIMATKLEASADHAKSFERLKEILREDNKLDAVIGEGVNLPMRVLIDQPPSDRRPDSADAQVFDEGVPGGWNKAREREDYAEVVALWRGQQSRSPRIVKD